MAAEKQAKPDPEDELEDEEDEETVESGDISFIVGFMRPYFAPYKKALWILAGILLVETAFNFSFPLVTQHLIDEGLQEKNWDVVVWVLGFLVFAAVANTVLGVFSDLLYTRTATNITRDLRQSLFDHLHRMSMPYFHRTQTGMITSRFSGDIVATETALVTLVPYFLTPALEVVYSTVLLLILSPTLGAIALVGFPLVLWLPKLFATKAFGLAYEKRRTEGRIMGFVQENVSAQPVLKAFGLARRVRDDFKGINSTWFGIASRGNFHAALVERASHSGLYVLHIIVFGIGVYWVFTDTITLGTLVAFEGVFLSMGYALTDVTQYVPNLAQAVGGARHMDEFLSEKPTISDKEGAVDAPAFAKAIEFDNVGFSYGEEDRRPGEPTAASAWRISTSSSRRARCSASWASRARQEHGAEPPAALQRSDGGRGEARRGRPARRDAGELSPPARRGVPGELPVQHLDHREHPPRQARRHHGRDPRRRPAGGGRGLHPVPAPAMGDLRRRARLAALGRPAPAHRDRAGAGAGPALLVLDEATSALDAATEGRLNETLVRIARTRTVVSVTHRLGSVVAADRIILMDSGRIAESGTHDELVALGGLYAALWKTQRNAVPDRVEDDDEGDEDEDE